MPGSENPSDNQPRPSLEKLKMTMSDRTGQSRAQDRSSPAPTGSATGAQDRSSPSGLGLLSSATRSSLITILLLLPVFGPRPGNE